jgi:hypothetical protein
MVFSRFGEFVIKTMRTLSNDLYAAALLTVAPEEMMFSRGRSTLSTKQFPFL